LLTFTMAAHTVAAGRPDTSDIVAGPCGDVVVTGEVPLGPPSHVDAAVDTPEVLALRYFADALTRRGVTVLPSLPGTGPLPDVVDAPFTALPPGTVVWRHDGEPLSALLADMWLPSDNLIAEELLREIDVAANARAGTLAGGHALERIWLRGIGVDPTTLTLADGSGLSQYDRFTPRALVAILAHDWHGTGRALVQDALPLAGVRGDLRNAMRGTPAAGHVYAKTGSMSHVRGLAGYVVTRTQGAVVFALSIDDWMGNDTDLAAVRAAFCSRLAQL
jgi:D-alanyl-D-alanine carboxypeptidase/D-alanyl-D-alanine-endopeptidase (penicillin-binding protein 4)